MGKLTTGIIKATINGVSRSRMSVVGFVLVVVLFPVLLGSIIFDLYGVGQNPYFGFLIYLVIGPLFALGIVLIFLGITFSKGREDIGLFAVEYLKEQLSRPGRFTRVRKLIYLATGIAILTFFAVGLVTYTGFHYTESTSFCGQFCHNVMDPEFVTYQNSPHSRVACVDCHIGEGAKWLTKAKLSGVRQLVATALDTYPRPITTPIDALRPERETCERCHRPEKFHGDKLFVKDQFLPDESNTHVQTAMLMKIGSGGYSGRKAHGIHWHVSRDYQVRYLASDDSRENILVVTLTGPGGLKETYYSKKDLTPSELKLDQSTAKKLKFQLMDCMDCHNRPTHIFLSPDEALNLKIITNAIPRELPFIKKKGLEVINKDYATTEAAKLTIGKELRGWYKQHYPELYNNQKDLIDRGVAGVEQAYLENVFPSMNIRWETYKNFIGHKDGTGCFRCHDGTHMTREGKVISNDCQTCHVLLAVEKPGPNIIELLKGADE